MEVTAAAARVVAVRVVAAKLVVVVVATVLVEVAAEVVRLAVAMAETVQSRMHSPPGCRHCRMRAGCCSPEPVLG